MRYILAVLIYVLVGIGYNGEYQRIYGDNGSWIGSLSRTWLWPVAIGVPLADVGYIGQKVANKTKSDGALVILSERWTR